MEFVTLDSWPPAEKTDYRTDLESGNVLYFPKSPFALPSESQEFLRGLDFAGSALHKNIAYRPAADRISGIEAGTPEGARLLTIMRDYSRSATNFTRELLPEYGKAWKLDYASFRPLEEDGRDLPINKRNDLIHTDAFPSRPTNGDLILRVFTNINRSKTRNWITTDPFAVLAERYARNAGLEKIATQATSIGGKMLNQGLASLKSLGFPVVPRSAYDKFMLSFHEYLKRNADFQANCPKYRFDFPPGSAWLTFTDVLPHSVHSGQHALEQTFIVARSSLADGTKAPISILERLCGKALLPV